MKGVLVAGSASGVGKTTVALALMAAATRRGLVVQAFKGGPDFLDTGHHTRISGRVARNVDTWMLSAKANLDVVRGAAEGADFVVVEGMMGLFDGKSGDSNVGSSAEIAKLLGLPVILVLDAGKSARSLAAVVLGFELFDPETPIAGVILNRVGSERHYEMLLSAIQQRCKTPVLGWLARTPAIAIPERHLGLRAAEESGVSAEAEVDALAAFAEEHVDVAAVLGMECGLGFGTLAAKSKVRAKVRIGVARDKAFCFYYEDNLDLLRAAGAEIVLFSPLKDSGLPRDVDGLYLGGGYPELHAGVLSENAGMLAAVKAFAESGRPVYAECGGMMFLGEQVSGADGVGYPMAGVLPLRFEMTEKLVKFGYCTVELVRDCLIGDKGMRVRGHSFHYSKVSDTTTAVCSASQTGTERQRDPLPTGTSGSLLEVDKELETAYDIEYSLSGRREEEGYSAGNVLASYVHLHFRVEPSIAGRLVAAAASVKAELEVLA